MKKRLQHLLYVISNAVRAPRIAWLGAREFRLSSTPHFAHDDDLEAYDSGRELAHILTFRHFDF